MTTWEFGATKAFACELLIGDPTRRRIRAWVENLEQETVIDFEVATRFNMNEWEVDLHGSFKWDDCANFDSNTGVMIHTCGMDGFAEWCADVALIPALVADCRKARDARA